MTIKKHILLLLFIPFIFSSCKKDYTCECTTTLGSIESKTTSENRFGSLDEAIETCKKNENLTGTPTVSCKVL